MKQGIAKIRKMSQVIGLCEDRDDSGEWPNTASVPSLLCTLPLSRKRPRDKEKLSNDAHLRNDNGPGNKTATGSDELEVSPHKKRRGVMKSERSVKHGAAGECLQISRGFEATEKDVGSEDAEVMDRRESPESIAAAASHPMNSDAEQTRRDGGSANKHFQKLPTIKPPSHATGRQCESLLVTAVAGGNQQVINEEDFTANTSLGRESTIIIDDSDDSSKEALPFQSGDWAKKFMELCEYRQSKGQCIFRCQDPEYAELSKWVFSQRREYRRMVGGKDSILTPERVKTLEGIGFVWNLAHASWENRLSELADYQKIQGHCNVPQRYSENSKLARWVKKQRNQYRLHLEGKTSSMTTFRIQALESLGFEWGECFTAWEDRLSELADYRKIHGHCNVPHRYIENTKLGKWVGTQRTNYRLHLEGKPSPMTLPRIQALQSLGFEWKHSLGRTKGTPKKLSLDDDTTRVRERAVEAPEHMQQHSLKKISVVEKFAAIRSTSLSNPKNPTGMGKSTSTSSRVEPQNIKRVEAGGARVGEADLGGSPSELAAKPSLYSDRQAAKSLSPAESASAGDSVESNTRKDALQAKLPWPAHQQKSINSFSNALLVAAPPENDFIVATKKPANSGQGTEFNKITRANPVAAEPLQQRRNLFTHTLLLGDGSTGNGAQATPGKPANAQQDTQQTPPDEVFQSDNVLNEVELELIWLGEESMYCLSCPAFQFDFIYEYASPALKVELRKLSKDDQSEAEKQKQIVRMKDWLVSRRFDFVRKDIRKKLVRGFRRQRMRIVIAELRLLRRHQSKRHFPATVSSLAGPRLRR
jgi:hypothetical protein